MLNQAWQVSEDNIGGALFTIQPTKPYQTPQIRFRAVANSSIDGVLLGFKIAFVARTQNRLERLNAMLRSHGGISNR